MIRPPPRSPRTDTSFPYTTLFLSSRRLLDAVTAWLHDGRAGRFGLCRRDLPSHDPRLLQGVAVPGGRLRHHCDASRAGHAQDGRTERSEEHTSELQSLMRISYAVFCLKKKTIKYKHTLSERY